MARLRLALLGATALLGPVTGAHAQNNFPSAGGATVPGSVAHYLNPSSVAIPASAANPFPVTVLSGTGVAVTVADGADVAQGTTTDAACATDNGTCTVEAVLKRIAQRITSSFTSIVLQAGANIVGKVGIDQTTPGTTNGIVPLPSSAATAAVTPQTTAAAASNAVLKASAGNLYDVTVTIGATSGWVMIFDATALPSNGATGASLKWCYPVLSNGTVGGINKVWHQPISFATGITVGFSSTACNSLTASATAFFYGGIQ